MPIDISKVNTSSTLPTSDPNSVEKNQESEWQPDRNKDFDSPMTIKSPKQSFIEILNSTTDLPIVDDMKQLKSIVITELKESSKSSLNND